MTGISLAAVADDVEMVPAPCDGCAQRPHCSRSKVACHALADYVDGREVSATLPRIPNKFYFCRVFD